MSDPLQLSDFFDLIGWEEFRMWLDPMQDVSGDGRGVRYPIERAEPIWRAEGTLDQTMTHAEAAKIQALIEKLDGVLGSFNAYDTRLPYPINDPDGTVINAWQDNVVIADVANDNQRIRLTHMPPVYRLAIGDRVSFSFGSNPSHRGLHRCVSTVQSDPAGDTGWLTIRPHLVDGASLIGNPVRLAKPIGEFSLAKGGYQPGMGRGTITPGGTLRFEQVL